MRPSAPHHEFHTVLGELTLNPVLQLFIDVLIRLTSRCAADPRTTALDGKWAEVLVAAMGADIAADGCRLGSELLRRRWSRP